jgi:hypothetical protein
LVKGCLKGQRESRKEPGQRTRPTYKKKGEPKARERMSVINSKDQQKVFFSFNFQRNFSISMLYFLAVDSEDEALQSLAAGKKDQDFCGILSPF